MLTIIGGTYRENCLVPNWDRLFGSGVRAAIAASQICHDAGSPLNFYTCATKAEELEVDVILKSFGVDSHFTRRSIPIEFQYNHSADKAVLFPDYRELELVNSMLVPKSIDNALIFSLIELQQLPSLTCNRVVYDPQAGNRSQPFSEYGCDFRSLVIVCNLGEARALAQSAGVTDVERRTPNYLARKILAAEKADGVVVKMGFAGAHVVNRHGTSKNIPAYKTDRVFGIGSGDVFSAVFAATWAELKMDLFSAAKTASAATAYYCSTTVQFERALPCIPPNVTKHISQISPMNASLMTKFGALRKPTNTQVYLAGPFFNLAQVWMIDECSRCLRSMDLDVWSPMAELGVLPANADIESVRHIVRNDIRGLDTSGSVFAILDGLDPGTIFEVGYAVKRGIPVTILAEQPSAHDLTMFLGSPLCHVCDDLPTALYHCGWQAHKL